VDVEIRPEPSPDERQALLASLERLLADQEPPAAYRSGWRKQGLLENIAPDGAGELRIERWVRRG
jgi:hypothetical protein